MNHSTVVVDVIIVNGYSSEVFKFSYDTFMIHYTGSHCFTSPAV